MLSVSRGSLNSSITFLRSHLKIIKENAQEHKEYLDGMSPRERIEKVDMYNRVLINMQDNIIEFCGRLYYMPNTIEEFSGRKIKRKEIVYFINKCRI